MATKETDTKDSAGSAMSVGRTKAKEFVISWRCEADGTPYSFPHRESVRCSREEAEWLHAELGRQLGIKDKTP